MLRGSPLARAESAVAGQRGVRGHAVLDRQQRGQPGHAVGSRPQRHVPIGLGPTAPGHERLRVEPVGLLLTGRDELALAQPFEALLVGCHRRRRPPRGPPGQARGLARHQGGLPLRDPAGPPGCPGVRQLGRDDPGQAEVPLAAVRGLTTGKRDLRGNSAAPPRGRDGGGGLVGPLGLVELRSERGLGRGRRRRPAPPALGSRRPAPRRRARWVVRARRTALPARPARWVAHASLESNIRSIMPHHPRLSQRSRFGRGRQ